MIPEPKPKKELHIDVWPGNSGILSLYAYSSDAQVFCDRLSKYGDLKQERRENGFSKYMLSIYPSFDYQEVIKYIESYNEEK